MKSLKSKKGITLIALVVTLVLMTILTTVTITSTNVGTDFRRYSLMCSDIELLEDKVLYFYRQYGELPIGNEVTSIPSEISNGHTFYEINMNKLSGITLNFGETEDIYIIDSETFEVYYENGIEYEGKIYYTD